MPCCRIVELRMKEVINLCDGARLGYIGDVEIDLECGRVCAIVVPAPCFFFGLFGHGEDYVIPWEAIDKIGDDIVLVRWETRSHPRPKRGWRERWHEK